MTRDEQIALMLEHKIIAVVRSPDSEKLVDVARALLDGGVPVMEITFTVPNALQVIADVRKALGDKVLLGAGTVLDPETARSAILAGAEFVVSPTVNTDVIRLCHRYDRAVLPGAFTPTEILTAWDHGADIVKVFPADVGGPNYFKSVKGPLPQVRMMPTGGVTLDTAANFLKAGACCLGLGSALVDKRSIETRNFDHIRSLAQQYVAIVQSFVRGEDVTSTSFA